MGITSGILGVGGALAGMFGGGFGSPGSITPFSTPYSSYISPSTIAGQASNVGSSINQNAANAAGYNANLVPLAQRTVTNAYGNPSARGYISGAQTAGRMGQTAGTTAFNAGQGLVGTGQSLIPYATSIEQMGFDPQSALYLRSLQQLTDQINVANQQSGVSTSPYGASVMANALGNFNIDWQNNLLSRATQAAQAAGGLVGQAGSTIGQGAQIAGTAPLSYLQASGFPYSTRQQISGDQFSNLGQYLQLLQGGQGLTEAPIGDTISLMGAENQTNQQAVQAYQAMLGQYDTNLAAQRQTFGENQLLGSALGRSLGSIGGGFGGSGTGGNAWSGLNFNNSPLWGAAYNAFNPLPATGAFG